MSRVTRLVFSITIATIILKPVPANSSPHPMCKTTVKQSKNFKTTSLPIKPTLRSQTIHSSFFRLSDFLHKTRLVFSQQQKKNLGYYSRIGTYFQSFGKDNCIIFNTGKELYPTFSCINFKKSYLHAI